MPAGVDTLAEPLANELVRRKVLPAPQAVDIVRQLAHEMAQQHESGRLHLHIAADMVSYDTANSRAALREPHEEPRSFGGADCDDEFCPPELQQPRSVLLPVQLAAARDALRACGFSAVDPRRVDIYQLGALLCRLLTGESVSAFLSRPRVAAKVPAEVRDLIERALGHDPQRALRSVPELLRGLESLDAAGTVALPSAQPRSTRNVTEPDTTPSFIGVGKADTDAGRPAPSPIDDGALPFRKLGHYEIVGRLGRGGMGDVYKGYERRLDRYVAIKVLPAEFSRQEEMVKRFYAEASAAAKLVHPNTVEIHFIGEDEASSAEGQPAKVHFFAMRFVDGESLAELLTRRKRLSVDEALAIIEQALSGLSAAHRLGMVHRDIKPGNILIDRERQRVLLADFGLVKSLQAAASMTASGVIVGTVDYMAPEQGRGETVDARADLYAIGVVLYQMLSGRLPFQADSPTGMIFKHVYETPPSLHDVASDVPRSLAEIVAKLMSKPPDARYQTVEALLADLRAFHQGQPLPSAAASVPRTLDRPRTVIIPAPRFADESVLPATLTLLATPNRWQRVCQAIRDFLLIPAEEFVQQLQTTENQVDGAIAEYERRHASLRDAARDAESVVKELKDQSEVWQQAIAAAEQRATAATNDEAARAALAEKLRAERAIAELSEQRQSQQAQLEEMRQKLSQVTATLERLRSQRDVLNARLKVAQAQIRLSGGKASARRVKHWIYQLRWLNVSLLVLVLIALIGVSPILFKTAVGRLREDADFAKTMRSSTEVRIEETLGNASTMTELFLNPPNSFGQPFSGDVGQKQVLKLAVSPTGKHVATVTGERAVSLWDAESGRLLHRLSDNLREVHAAEFSHDGKILMTGETDGEMSLKFWDVNTGTFSGGIPDVTNGFNFHAMAASPTAPLIAITGASVDEKLIIWNYETRTRLWSINLKEAPSWLAFSPDGALLAGMGARGDVSVWDLKERKLLASWMTGKSAGRKLRPLFLPSGTELLTTHGGNSIAKWDARTGKLLSQTPGGLLANHSAWSVSKDGRWLAASSDSWITVVDSQSGLVRTIMSGHQTTATAFSPKGDKLYSVGGPPFLVRWDINSAVMSAKGWSREIIASPPFAIASQKPLCLLRQGTQLGVLNYETQGPLVQLKSNEPLGLGMAVAAFSQDALRVAVLDGEGRLRVWDLVSGTVRNTTLIPKSSLHPSATPHLTFSRDGDTVWVLTAVRLWRVDLQRSLVEPWLQWPNETVRVLSPDGRFLAVATSSGNLQGEWQVWDTATQSTLIPNDKTSESFDSFAFTRDGLRLLALDKSGWCQFWDLERTEVLDRFQINRSGRQPHQLLFLPGNRHVAVFSNPTLRVIDIEHHEDILRFEAPPAANTPRDGLVASQIADFFQITHDGLFAVTVGAGHDHLAFWSLYPQHRLGQAVPLPPRNSP